MQFHHILFALLGLVVAGLGGYLAYLLLLLRRRRQTAEAVAREHELSNQEQHEARIRSIEMISIAALAGDCELSEACIRIKHLLDFYPGLAGDARFALIGEMFEEIRDFDTHDARAALPRGEKREQDRARFAIEARYRQEMLAALGVLRERMAELRGSAFDIDVARGDSQRD